jgi:CheY-like chemotaxis protein
MHSAFFVDGKKAANYGTTAVVVLTSKSYKLLIADDDPGFRDALKLIFEPFFSMLEAASGEEAVSLIDRHRVDIALVDMHMTRLTGLDALRHLKSINAAAPGILITADASDELKRSARDADAFSVLKKPVIGLG